jgi:ABC-2 type transport system ATP-binding protein
MSIELLRMENVRKTYRRAGKEIVALSDFSMALHAGEVLGLLGPNGAGKTTAIKALVSLVEADSGIMRWRGQPVRGKGYLREVGVLLEGRGALNERLSTWENANYFCRLREGIFDPLHFDNMARLLALPDVHAPVRLLSTGNKLRSGLLLSLIHKPAVVFLDEPTIGLDLFGVQMLEELVRHVAAMGTAVMISSHDLQFVERLAQRIVCICRGRKVFDGSKSDFLHVEHAYVLSLQTGEDAPSLLPQLRGASNWRAGGPGVQRLQLHNHAELCAVLESLMPSLPSVRGIQIERVTLKEKYMALVDEAEQAA